MPKKLGTIDHRDRKNPRSAEQYALLRKQQNAARPKQVWNEETHSWEGR